MSSSTCNRAAAARTRPPLPALCTLTLAGLLAWPLGAAAEVTSEGGGDFAVVPLYRAYTFGGIDRDGNGSYDSEDILGIDYASNTTPKPLNSTFGSVSADGATNYLNGWSVSSGFFAARSFASMTVTNPNGNHNYYLVAGQGSATSVTFYTAEVANARARFTWQVSGTSTNPTDGVATGRLDFAATGESGHSWAELFSGGFDNTLFEYGPGTFTYTLPTVALGEPTYLYYWSSAYTEVNAGQFTPGQDFTITANYSNTVVLAGVELLDEFDNPISDWQMEYSDSGELLFDNTGRIAPIDAVPAIPEPGTWAMWLAGLAVLFGLHRPGRARAPAGAQA